MQVWLLVQFIAALVSVAAGATVAAAARSAIHEIEAILLVGFGALILAIISVGALLADRSKQDADQAAALLREIRDKQPAPPAATPEPARPRPAGSLAPLPSDPAPDRA